MSLRAREVSLRPAALDVARRLASRPGLAVLLSADGSGPSFVACDPVELSADIDPEPDLLRRPVALGTAPRWIGALPYEAFRGIERPSWRRSSSRSGERAWLSEPLWQRYEAVVCVSDRVTVVGDSRRVVDELARVLESSSPQPAQPVACVVQPGPDGEAEHRARVVEALELIRAGDLYQVNLARRLDYGVSGHPLDVLQAMVARAPGAYSCLLRTARGDVVGTSPELLVRFDAAGRIVTSPIKGTRVRGRHAAEEAAHAAALDADAKERAELTMVIDVERNDLGRISTAGSVRLVQAPRVSAMSGVLHRWASVASWARPGLGRAETLQVLLPSGSVTGAPKVRAMEVIADLEACPRGLYTGGVGAVCHDGSLNVGMAIRTLVVRDGVGHYFVGGGIVADSDPDLEVEETRWKAGQMTALGYATARRTLGAQEASRTWPAQSKASRLTP